MNNSLIKINNLRQQNHASFFCLLSCWSSLLKWIYKLYTSLCTCMNANFVMKLFAKFFTLLFANLFHLTVSCCTNYRSILSSGLKPLSMTFPCIMIMKNLFLTLRKIIIQSEIQDHSKPLETLWIPITYSMALDTILMCIEKNRIFFFVFSLNKPVITIK